MHLNRSPAGVPGQRGDQPRALTGHRALLGGGQRRVRKHLHRSRFHQRREIGGAVPCVLPDVSAVGRGDVGAGNHRRPVGGEVRVEPVLLALEPGRRDIGVFAPAEQVRKSRSWPWT